MCTCAKVLGRRSGQTIVFLTLSLTATFGIMALAVDIGIGYWRKQVCKSAAQAAALAAAQASKGYSACNVDGIVCQSDTPCPDTTEVVTNLGTGCAYAKANGFPSGSRQTLLMAGGSGIPPYNGIKADYWVSATAVERVPQLFATVLGKPWMEVRAQSGAVLYKPPSGACIYAMASTGTGLTVGGNVDVHSTCGMWVNSADGAAMTSGGSSFLEASEINVVGGYVNNGGATVNPYPSTGRNPTYDPLARVRPPAIPDRCDSYGITETSTIIMPPDNMYVVCANGFQMVSNRPLQIPGGTYILKDGVIDWRNGNLTSTGPVTFYMTGTFKSVNVNGNFDVDLSAPSSGPLQGMLMFQDRFRPLASVTINGGSGLHINGTLYFPGTDMAYSGGSATVDNYVGIVANRVTFPGTTYMKGDGTSLYTGIGLPSIGLVQ